jgi:mono/diheme cytochrome c family protein
MQGISRVAFAASAGILALTMFAAQAPAQSGPQTAPPPAAADAADAAARALVEKNCSGCHLLSQVTVQHKTADQWATTVDQMISFGAPVADEDYPKIVDYLAKHYGAQAGAAKPAAL